MKKLYYPAVFHPEERGYSVYVPSIEGCNTQGNTMEEACGYAVDAIGLCLEQYDAEGNERPVPCDPASIHLDPGDFLAMIEFDEVEYRKRNDSRSVKKTLTIPSWLNYLAEKANVNFSQTLQNALMEQLHVTG